MKRLLVLTATLLAFVSACNKEQGSEGGPCFPNATCNEGLACISELCVNEQRPSTATRVSALTTVDECPNGGQKIDTGIDDNLNGELDDDEVDQSVIVCNGSDGSDGQNCTVADGPGSGEKTVTCGTSSVVIRDGNDGTAGEDCTVVDGPNAGEHTVTCGSTSVVIADGAPGAPGVSCSVANGPSSGEHTVTCGSTSVVVQDGSNGAEGTPGANCTVTNGPNAGEHTVTCGDTSVVIVDGAQGAPGSSCSVANGPNAAEHTVTCGSTSVVVQDGSDGAAGAPGTSCTVANGPNAGEHTVTCGATSVVIADGAAGTPGASCSVASGPNAGEHTVTCGSTSVVVQDGSDGATGAPGESCTVANGPNAGEHTVTCGTTAVVIVDGLQGAPGASCSVTNGPNAGEHTVTCGSTSVVVQDGSDGAAGAPGTSCTVASGPNAGEHTVTCGATSVVIADGAAGTSACVLETDIVGASYATVPAGTFVMGSPVGELGRIGDELQHTARITRSFQIALTEVTQGQWIELSGGPNPSLFSSCGFSCPVEQVDWFSAVGYANALSAAMGLEQCYSLIGCNDPVDGWKDGESVGCSDALSVGLDCTGFRLPTESEWEFAYRAGTTSALYSGALTALGCQVDINNDPIAWYCGNAPPAPQPVAQKQPNEIGLFDMAGNVAEWVWDRYGAYPTTATDSEGPSVGDSRVIRGGDWNRGSADCRAASRGASIPVNRKSFDPAFLNDTYGFRLARTLPP